MMVESFNLALFKSLTASCALVLHELYDEHEQQVARVHLLALLAEEEDEELLAEVEVELLPQEEDKEILLENEGFEDTSGSCAVEDDNNSPASSLIEKNLVPAGKQSKAIVEGHLKNREEDLNISANKEAEDPIANFDFDNFKRDAFTFTQPKLTNTNSCAKLNKFPSESENVIKGGRNLENPKKFDRNLPHWVAACSQPELFDNLSGKFVPLPTNSYLEEDDPDYVAPSSTKEVEELYEELESDEIACLLKEAEEPLPESVKNLPDFDFLLNEETSAFDLGENDMETSEELANKTKEEASMELPIFEEKEEEKQDKEDLAPEDEKTSSFENSVEAKGTNMRKRKRKKLTSVIDELSTKVKELEPQLEREFAGGEFAGILIDSSEVLKIIEKYSDVALAGRTDQHDEGTTKKKKRKNGEKDPAEDFWSTANVLVEEEGKINSEVNGSLHQGLVAEPCVELPDIVAKISKTEESQESNYAEESMSSQSSGEEEEEDLTRSLEAEELEEVEEVEELELEEGGEVLIGDLDMQDQQHDKTDDMDAKEDDTTSEVESNSVELLEQKSNEEMIKAETSFPSVENENPKEALVDRNEQELDKDAQESNDKKLEEDAQESDDKKLEEDADSASCTCIFICICIAEDGDEVVRNEEVKDLDAKDKEVKDEVDKNVEVKDLDTKNVEVKDLKEKSERVDAKCNVANSEVVEDLVKALKVVKEEQLVKVDASATVNNEEAKNEDKEDTDDEEKIDLEVPQVEAGAKNQESEDPDRSWEFTEAKWEFSTIESYAASKPTEPAQPENPLFLPSIPAGMVELAGSKVEMSEQPAENPQQLPSVVAEMANLVTDAIQQSPLSLPTITAEMAESVASKVEVSSKLLPRLRFFPEAEMPKMRDLPKTAKKSWGRGSDVRAHLKRLQRNASVNKAF